jgi:hypothetical protein
MFKRLLELLKLNTPRQPILQQCSVVCSNPTVEHKTFTENIEFIKSADFELIWVAKNVNDDYNAADCLNDDEYLDYKLWEDINTETMYKKRLPNTHLFRGKNPNIIFHGGCLGCMSQRLHGLERCKGCRYFRRKSGSQDLRINGEEAAKMDANELRRLLGG